MKDCTITVVTGHMAWDGDPQDRMSLQRKRHSPPVQHLSPKERKNIFFSASGAREQKEKHSYL